MNNEIWINQCDFNPQPGEYWVKLGRDALWNKIKYQVFYYFSNNGITSKSQINHTFFMLSNDYLNLKGPCQYLKLNEHNFHEYVFNSDYICINPFKKEVLKFDWSYC